MRSTSLQAYADLVTSGALNQKQRAVWAVLHLDGPKTGRELDRTLNTQDAHKRLSELERAGVVEEMHKTTCSVTGKKAVLWRITEKDPNSVQSHELRPLTTPQKPSDTDIIAAVAKIKSELPNDAQTISVTKLLLWLDHRARR